MTGGSRNCVWGRGVLGAVPFAAVAALLLLSLARPVQGATGKVRDISPVSLSGILRQATKPVLLEFYAPDCYFCQELAPVLDEVAAELADKVIVLQVDMRTSFELNRKFGVRSSPTMLLFRSGEEIFESREELQGMRTTSSLKLFLERHLTDAVEKVGHIDRVRQFINKDGVVVLGAFASEDDAGVKIFKRVAEKERKHVQFVASYDEATSLTLLEHYDVSKAGNILIIKQDDTFLGYMGSFEKADELSMFISNFAFPLVGHLTAYNYERYKKLETPKVYLFYDENMPTLATTAGLSAMFEVSKKHDLTKFVMVSYMANDDAENTLFLFQKLGVSDFVLPSIAIVSGNGNAGMVYNQMEEITAEGLTDFLALFSRPAYSTRQTCQINSFQAPISNWTEPLVKEYSYYTNLMKSRIYAEKSMLEEINEQQFRPEERDTMRDVITLYTARWCTHALKAEKTLNDLFASGIFDDFLRTDIVVKVVDVVENPPWTANKLEVVPSLRYLSARSKKHPVWFTGNMQSPEDLANWVLAYHSMRYVDVPNTENPVLAHLERQRRLEEQGMEGGESWRMPLDFDYQMDVDELDFGAPVVGSGGKDEL